MKKRIVILLIIINLFICFEYIRINRGLFNISNNYFIKNKNDEQSQYAIKGKDDVIFWNDGKFQIGKYNENELFLTMYNNKNISKMLLKDIINYEVSRNTLYVISREGYAVINQNNECKIFIIVSDDEYISGYSIDSNGNKHSITRFVEDNHIKYISSYDEFLQEERDIFENMNQENK